MKTALTVVILFLFMTLQQGEGKRYCKVDSDCSDLGALSCIKSKCEYGVCGCKRGYASRFMGHDKFQCVKLKRVGEECSTLGDAGICVAKNSNCDEVTGKCKCSQNYESLWGGERCSQRGDNLWEGETCGLDSLSQCRSSCESTESNSGWYSVVARVTPTCACQNNEMLRLVSDNADFYGPRIPKCDSVRVGDFCLLDAECPHNSTCDHNKCTCFKGQVPDYDKTRCDYGLAFGIACSDKSGHCDGDKGLVCGDDCELTDPPNVTACTCGLSHRKSGTSCSPIGRGGSCYGDLNCKWYNDDDICEDGICREGASSMMMMTSLLLVFGLPAFNVLYNIC